MELIASEEAKARLVAMLILQKEGYGKIVISPISEKDIPKRIKDKFLQEKEHD